MIISQNHSLLYWKLEVGVGWLVCWYIAPGSPWRTACTLASCLLLLSTHSLGRREVCASLWVSPAKGGRRYGKSSSGQKTAAKGKHGNIYGWDLSCKVRDTRKSGQMKRPEHYQCKSYSFNLMECIWAGVGVIHFLGGCPCYEHLWSLSFIHASIQGIFTKHLLTT